MATLQARLADLISAVGTDIKSIGILSSLTTTSKTTLVSAVNEVNAKTPKVVVVTNFADAGVQPSGTLVISTSGT